MSKGKKEANRFPNGFEEWHETHYQMVVAVNANEEACLDRNVGTGGLWDIAKDWTDEFEEKYKGRNWDGEWFDAIYEFLDTKIN